MAERAVIVVAFDNENIESFREILHKLKPMFEDKENVQVFGAVKETAQSVVEILAGGINGETRS